MLKKQNFAYEEINNLYINHLQFFNKLDEIAKNYGLTFAQYSILLSIVEYGCKTPTEITSNLKISRTSASKTLNILLKKKLIQKSHNNEVDQRKVFIEVMNQGAEVVESIKNDLNLAINNKPLNSISFV